MARGPCSFRQRDLTAAIKAAIAAGIRVARMRATDDRGNTITVETAGPDETPQDTPQDKPNEEIIL